MFGTSKVLFFSAVIISTFAVIPGLILKSLLSNILTNGEVIALIQEEIDRQETELTEEIAQEDEKADHMIYGFFDIDKDGSIATVRLYSGLAKTDDEFEAVAARLDNAHIYAIHARHNY